MSSIRDLARGAPADYLIIGGGAAGCVLASRLSERPDLNVLLVERGGVYPAGGEPAVISDFGSRSLFSPAHMWGELKAIAKGHPDSADDSTALPYAAGRTLGGGSSVNGMLAHRGLPGDYDEWSEFGVSGWSWNDVLPFFRKLEADQDFDGPCHGKDGPMPIRRFAERQWSGFERAVSDQWQQRQLPWMADLTGDQPTGHGPMPLNVSHGRRVSVARAYLDPQVRARPNLTIIGDAEASRLLIEDGRAHGALFTGAFGEVEIKAHNVIVSAGAISSPTLLLRSGIGPAATLAASGRNILLDRPGVGGNLQEHASLLVAAHLPRSSRRQARLPACLSFARYSSGTPGCAEADMMVTTMGIAPGATAWNPLGRSFGALLAILHKPYSRGAVRLDADGRPRVMFNLLSDERDLTRMIDGWQTVRAIMEGAAGSVNQAFVPLTLGRTDDSLMTALVSTVGAITLDGPAALRRRILKSVGIPLDAIPRNGDQLREWVTTFTGPAAHATGTCRMGQAADPNAVVDSDCRVIGVDGLHVVDTSIFPTLMRSGTHLPVIMAGEKAAASILGR